MGAAVRAIRPTPQTWLSPEQVSEMLPGITVKNLERMRSNGRGPRYAKPSPKTVLYAEADIHAWVATTIRETREQR